MSEVTDKYSVASNNGYVVYPKTPVKKAQTLTPISPKIKPPVQTINSANAAKSAQTALKLSFVTSSDSFLFVLTLSFFSSLFFKGITSHDTYLYLFIITFFFAFINSFKRKKRAKVKMDFANENLLIDLGFELIKGMEEKK